MISFLSPFLRSSLHYCRSYSRVKLECSIKIEIAQSENAPHRLKITSCDKANNSWPVSLSRRQVF